MSTIKAANLQNTGSGAPVFKNNSGTEIGTLCRAWVSFDGTGTVAIRDDFNVSSITDNGTGDYTITFTNNMANANYVVTGTAGYGSAYWLNMYPHTQGSSPWEQAPTTSAFRVVTSRDGTNAGREDPGYVNVVVFGD